MSALGRGKLSASCPGSFTVGKTVPTTNYTGGLVGPHGYRNIDYDGLQSMNQVGTLDL
jgi:hypothetical protein